MAVGRDELLVRLKRATQALQNVRRVLGASTGIPCGADEWLNELAAIGALLESLAPMQE